MERLDSERDYEEALRGAVVGKSKWLFSKMKLFDTFFFCKLNKPGKKKITNNLI